jgi:hypothetical protein
MNEHCSKKPGCFAFPGVVASLATQIPPGHNAAVRPQPKRTKHRRDAEGAEARRVYFFLCRSPESSAENAEQGKEKRNLSVFALKKCCQKSKKLRRSNTRPRRNTKGLLSWRLCILAVALCHTSQWPEMRVIIGIVQLKKLAIPKSILLCYDVWARALTSD